MAYATALYFTLSCMTSVGFGNVSAFTTLIYLLIYPEVKIPAVSTGPEAKILSWSASRSRKCGLGVGLGLILKVWSRLISFIYLFIQLFFGNVSAFTEAEKIFVVFMMIFGCE